MQSIKEYLGISSFQDSVEIKKKSTEIREKLKKEGYISSNFGWVKKEWIDYGYKIGALAKFPLENKDGSFTYSLTGGVYKKISYEGYGRSKEEKEVEKIDEKKALIFIKYIDMKKGLCSESEFNSYKIQISMKNIP